MKFLLVSIVLFCISGCGIKDELAKRKNLRDISTISESFYLVTVLHDEHLFIIRQGCGILHHPNCPCLKNETVEKPLQEPKSPIIFISPLK